MIEAHGGKLVNQMVKDAAKKQSLISGCNGLTLELNERQSCDFELIVNGGFSPLTGFMNKEAYESVVEKMRLPGSNLLFGLPVVLDTSDPKLVPGKSVVLRYNNQTLGVMNIESRFVPNKAKETKLCYKTASLEHPGVVMVAMERAHTYIGGTVHGFELPKRVFPCKTPLEVRAELPKDTDVVVFQCRNPIHRAHYELFIRSLDAPNVDKKAVVMVHPTCGPTQADDIPGIARYHTYVKLKEELKNPRVVWNYLPYSMHMAGPREAIQHMIIRKNYGCTHFIVGRDMAGSKSSLTSDDFYGAYDAQDFAKANQTELGMDTVPSLNLVYVESHGYITAEEAAEKKLKPLKLSGTEFRKRLRAGEQIPEWFAFKSVVEVLRNETKD